jgi:hypothetical protein
MLSASNARADATRGTRIDFLTKRAGSNFAHLAKEIVDTVITICQCAFGTLVTVSTFFAVAPVALETKVGPQPPLITVNAKKSIAREAIVGTTRRALSIAAIVEAACFTCA